ncbi:hypothetical protein [Gracilibacillus xinjiangensis]|uniref:Uncharacterized protein n=1 Tax=Gracilibacillus xinjiangensis TaxID=1193282 RepID=A0ABV8WXS7_9BACI
MSDANARILTTFTGYSLQKDSTFSINYTTPSNEIEIYLVEYSDQSLEDTLILENHSDYKTPENGHYYFLLKNNSKDEGSSDVVDFSVKINNNL